MTIISDIEARTHFASLLARAAAGEEIAVRLGSGRMVYLVADRTPETPEPAHHSGVVQHAESADLPAHIPPGASVDEVIGILRAIRRRTRVPDGMTFRQFLHEGRDE